MGIEDLATGSRGFGRFRTAAKKINKRYFDAIPEDLLIELSKATKVAEAATRDLENYIARNFSARISAGIGNYSQSTNSLIAGLSRLWLSELRRLRFLRKAELDLSGLSELDDYTLMRLYKPPHSEYLKRTVGQLASHVEAELSAIAGTLPDEETKALAPLLLFLAQTKTPSVAEFLSTTRGISFSRTDTAYLEVLVNEAVSGKGYFVRQTLSASEVVRLSPVISKLGIKIDQLMPEQAFLIRQNGVDRGFMIVLDEGGPKSPPYIFPFIEGDAATALRLPNALAKSLGYDAVKINLLLDNAAIQAAADAELYLLETRRLTAGTLAGVFVDVLSAGEATRRAYGAATKSRLEFVLEAAQEKSDMETIVAATWTSLTAREVMLSNLPGNKIRHVTLEVPKKDGKETYVFSFDKNQKPTSNRIYVFKGDGSDADPAKAKAVKAAASRVAKFFNGSVTRLNPEEFTAEGGGSSGVFYCAHTKNLPTALVSVSANFSVDNVLRYVASRARAAGYERAHVDVCYDNLSSEELANSVLPSREVAIIKEKVSTNYMPEELLEATLPQSISGATIKVISPSNTHLVVRYELSEGGPQLVIIPDKPDSQPDKQILEEDLNRIAGMLLNHYYTSEPYQPLVTPLSAPSIDGSSALIRLNALPSPEGLKRTFDKFSTVDSPIDYFVKELRWRTVTRTETTTRPYS
ncbi:hypothetical protein HYY73_06560 [Candidatus Woesearchaeota archaeon]|nr:hypothetical protein [Candidatus Woesearchaeota archaeon]